MDFLQLNVSGLTSLVVNRDPKLNARRDLTPALLEKIVSLFCYSAKKKLYQENLKTKENLRFALDPSAETRALKSYYTIAPLKYYNFG